MNGYVEEVFEASLIFGLLASLLGIIAAYHYGEVFPLYALLALVGVLLAQISANVLDDYIDYKSGIDKYTAKTGLNGGSKVLVEKRAKPEYVLAMGLISFFAALAIGAYLSILYPPVIPFIIIGATSILLYAKYLVKVAFLSEFSIGISFFSISVGVFLISGMSYTHIASIAIVSILAGMMVGLAGFVNGIADKKADKRCGRKTCSTFMSRCAGSYYYLITLFLGYVALLIGIYFGYVPQAMAITLLLIPFILYVFFGVKNYKNPLKFGSRVKMHFIIYIAMLLLMMLSYLIA